MKISQMVFKLQIGHEYISAKFLKISKFSSFWADTILRQSDNVQMAITPKAGKPQLWCLSSACCLMVVNISVKFRKNISNGFHVSKRTLFCE